MPAPQNLITARSEVMILNANPEVAQAHRLGFFLDCSCVATAGVIHLDGVVNPATSSNWLMHDIVKEMYDRLAANLVLLSSAVSISLVKVVQNETGGEDETLIGLDISDYTDVDGGTGAGIGGSIITYNLQSAGGQNARIIFTDQGGSIPKKLPGITMPAIDNGSLPWFLLRSNVPFCTQDGERLTRIVSISFEYNRKHLREYGYEYNSTL